MTWTKQAKRCLRLDHRLNIRYSSTSSPARTRFAPSPTGQLHLGSLRTALYNYLWAKKTGGQFLVRIEDTDRKRLVDGAEHSLFETLRWAQLSIDEGPIEGGPHHPYRQSSRLEIYQHHLSNLLASGSAYRCFCSPERLSSLKKEARDNGLSGTYDRKCSHLDPAFAAGRAASGESHVVRLKTPSIYPVVHDLVHGAVKFHHSHASSTINFDDPVLMKSDGFPTYHFANVVDDHLMQITHVIRGEEWLPSTPKHLVLYEAFGWKAPFFAHVPLLANPSGTKLSKRHGDATVEDFRAKGYLPEALLNYLALMGWNSKTESDVMSLEEMVERFEITDITKGSAIVTPDKLNFLQKQHFIKATDSETGMKRLVEQTQHELVRKHKASTFADAYVASVIDVLKERIVDPMGVPELGVYFFESPDYNNPSAQKFISKFERKQALSLKQVVAVLHGAFEKIEDSQWNEASFDAAVEKLFEETGVKVENSQVMGAIRFAVAGGLSGAGVKAIMQILGRKITLERLYQAQAACN